MSRSARAVMLALCAGLLPEAAAACSVCYAGAEESRKAFLLTTLFLSVLPLGMFGALFWWFRRRMREADRAQVETRTTAAIPSGPGIGTSAGSPQTH
jgi:hypothetical protein